MNSSFSTESLTSLTTSETSTITTPSLPGTPQKHLSTSAFSETEPQTSFKTGATNLNLVLLPGSPPCLPPSVGIPSHGLQSQVGASELLLVVPKQKVLQVPKADLLSMAQALREYYELLATCVAKS